jgi:redox-sensitive bicupin YhaK (pirin superfamily)
MDAITKKHHVYNKSVLGTSLKRAHCPFMKTLDAKQTIVKRRADARGVAEHGWLHSRHTFSFGEYFDADQMGFRALRVINDDIVEAGGGFGAHPHRDAEIFSYVIEGELEHKDSLGNGSVIKAGDLQYISAGSGVTHSEFNPSKTKRVHFYQVWLTPNVSGGKPRYAEKKLGTAAKANALTLLFAPTERDGAVAIRQDAEIYFGRLDAGRKLSVSVGPDRHLWIQVIKGAISSVGESLLAGDGLAISNSESIEIESEQDAEFLVFNLA